VETETNVNTQKQYLNGEFSHILERQRFHFVCYRAEASQSLYVTKRDGAQLVGGTELKNKYLWGTVHC
jgi:hypothetical protein